VSEFFENPLLECGCIPIFIMVFKMRTNNILGFEEPLGKIWGLAHSEIKFQKNGGGLNIFLKTPDSSQRKEEETVLFLRKRFPKKSIHFDGRTAEKVWFSVRPKKPAQISSG
jgi:hypothetical protein